MKESDPHGLGQHDPGAKLDAGKPQLWEVLRHFPLALREVAKVVEYGAGKYSEGGWVQVADGPRRYSNAELRHAFPENVNEATDPQSGLLHAAHRAWNALATLELMLREERDV